MRDDIPSTVNNLLARELGMYKTLRAMVSKELEAIVLNQDMEELLNILQEKQEVIAQLQLLADSWTDVVPGLGIQEARGSVSFWDKLASLFSQEEAQIFSQTLQETRLAAEDLMEAEDSAQKELEKHVQFLRDKMKSMSRGREAFIGYTKMGGSSS